jgi:long-subunit acyl-CoA synthetase (AMP-forming)
LYEKEYRYLQNTLLEMPGGQEKLFKVAVESVKSAGARAAVASEVESQPKLVFGYLHYKIGGQNDSYLKVSCFLQKMIGSLMNTMVCCVPKLVKIVFSKNKSEKLARFCWPFLAQFI